MSHPSIPAKPADTVHRPDPNARDLNARYGGHPPRTAAGRARRRRLAWLAGAAGLTALLFIAWSSFGKGPSAEYKLNSYSVTDATQAMLRFEVTKPPERAAQCAVKALDNNYGVVGWKVIDVPADTHGPQTTTQTVPLRTDSLAVTAVVDSCWVASD